MSDENKKVEEAKKEQYIETDTAVNKKKSREGLEVLVRRYEARIEDLKFNLDKINSQIRLSRAQHSVDLVLLNEKAATSNQSTRNKITEFCDSKLELDLLVLGRNRDQIKKDIDHYKKELRETKIDLKRVRK